MAFTRPQRKSLDKDQPLASSTGFEPSLMLRDVTMQSAARVFRPWRPAPPEEARQSLLDASPGQQSDDVPLIEAIERPAMGRWSNTSKTEFLNYCQRFAYVGYWCGLLLLNFGICRLFVSWNHLPSDGDSHEDAYDVYNSINHMLFYGIILAWFTAITEVERAKWLFHWKRWYFYVPFFAVSPIYSLLSNAEALQHSFEDVDQWGGAMWTVIVLASIAALIIVIWHMYYAFQHYSIYGMAMYLLLRIFVIVYYWIFSELMEDTHHHDMHLHHYFTTWLVAMFAEFNHPISAIMLGTLSSVFVQGIGAYGFDPLFNDATCRVLRAEHFGRCDFYSSGEFKMEMCPGKYDDVEFKCFRRPTSTFTINEPNTPDFLSGI